MSKNIKLTSRYTVFVIMMTNHIIHPLLTCYGKNSHMRGEYISAIFGEKILKRSDVSLYDHRFHLIYCQCNTREAGAVCNVSFLTFFYDNSPSISCSYISTSVVAVYRTQPRPQELVVRAAQYHII